MADYNFTEFCDVDIMEEIFDEGDDDLPSNEVCPTQRDMWCPQITKLLVVTRLAMEADFVQGKRNRNSLWNQCLNEMKKSLPNLKLSSVDVRKKFSNLLVTYNRIKKRKEKSGRGGIYWKFFEEFNSVYGVRHNIVPPKGLLFDSSVNIEVDESNSLAIDFDSVNESIQNENTSRNANKRKKDKHDALLVYLKKEDEKDDIRHQEMMNLEKEKINCLKEIVAMLHK